MKAVKSIVALVLMVGAFTFTERRFKVDPKCPKCGSTMSTTAMHFSNDIRQGVPFDRVITNCNDDHHRGCWWSDETKVERW